MVELPYSVRQKFKQENQVCLRSVSQCPRLNAGILTPGPFSGLPTILHHTIQTRHKVMLIL